MAEISVIIPVRNANRYLNQCLDSVLGQTMRDIEIICVDDGSTDNSLAILKDYAQRDNRIVIISQPHGGLSVARNAGLKAVRSPYFQFLDSDDLLHPQALEILYNIITKEKVEFAQCDHVKVEEDFEPKQIIGISIPPEYQVSTNVLDDFFNSRENRQTVAWVRMCRTDIFRNILSPVEIGPSQDTVHTMRILYATKSAVFIRAPLIYYRKHSASTTKSKITPKYIDSLFNAAVMLHDELCSCKTLTDGQRSLLRKFIARKLLHPVGKTIRKMPNGADRKKTLAELKQRLSELAQRGVFVISDLSLRYRLAANSFLYGRAWLAKVLLWYNI